jgi:GT2 family glycosyltransferase
VDGGTSCYTQTVAELAVVVVSYNSVRWLDPCLASIHAHRGEVELDVVVVDNESTDGSAELVEAHYPDAHVIRSPNRGFAFANNRAVLATDAPFILFLNPDTEILEGTFGELLGQLRVRPEVGLVGCRQLDSSGRLYPTIRRFPSATRLFFEAFGSERFPFRASWLGERELDPAPYDRETPCDWTSGSFMLARRQALLDAGLMDEQFFMYCEEPDLCLRMRRAGWETRHLPTMTIVHHVGNAGWNERLAAQDAVARRQYFAKHFSPVHRTAALASFALGHLARAVLGGSDRTQRRKRRACARAALRALVGLDAPPFPVPQQAPAQLERALRRG